MPFRRILILSAALALALCELNAQTPFKVLVFSKTAEFRHGSIPDGISAIQQLATTNNFSVDATEDGGAFTESNLAQYQAIIFLCTTGDVLETNQQAALQAYIQAGGGYVGIHSAADTERNWPWYGQLVGVWQSNHPPGTATATIQIADRFHPSTKDLPDHWIRSDEWYNFQSNPAGKVHVLAWLNERSASNYFASASGAMGIDHPIAWCQNFDGGRSWYTGLGHTSSTYNEPLFRKHLLGGILWAAGAVPGDAGATVWANFEKTVLDNNGLIEPLSLDVASDGRVFYIERIGRLNVFLPATSTRVRTMLSVNSATSDGLIGIALDPGFSTNQWIYLTYGPVGTEVVRLSRFTMNSNVLDVASEQILLTVPIESDIANHLSGDLEFAPDGSLFVSFGDNSRFSGSPNNGYGPIDERPGEFRGDAQRTAANTMDLRGKILRIKPEPNGTYSIPPGNLFAPGTAQTRPEIYVMGCRNPFRIAVDQGSGWLYWGEVGPDASNDSATRGPRGYDEWNQARAPGFFGWPYGLGDNKPYMDFDFATSVANGSFNLTNVLNTSPNNTGLNNLPPAQPAWVWYPYGSSTEFPEVGVSSDRCAMAGAYYHFDPANLRPTRLPAYYDNTLFMFEFSRNWMREIKLDTNGNVLKINKFLPNFALNSPIKMKAGPDGALYLIEYGFGWRAQNTNGQLSRITYTAGNHAPVARASGTPTDGSVPLWVQFSAAGTSDPEAQPVTYSWDFNLDGVTDSTNASPSFNYASPGNFVARLTVTDPFGASGISDVFISAGNTRPQLTLQSPPDGSFYHWGEFVRFAVTVHDTEDGSTTNGAIPCAEVRLETALGHDNHAHAEDQLAGCQGAFQTLSDHQGTENTFYLVSAEYTDQGGPNVAPLTGVRTVRLNPRRLEAEHYKMSGGTMTQPTSDASGVREVAGIDHGDYLAFTPIHLTNINAVTIRCSALGAGGTIQARLNATNGPLLGSTLVSGTGGVYSNFTCALTDPGGTHTLYFVFLRNPGATDLFRINWFEFQGPGNGVPLQPFGGPAIALPGTIEAENFDLGGADIAFHDSSPGNSGGQYRLDTDVDLAATSDSSGGYNIESVKSNEWLRYSVQVATHGFYTLQVRVASAGPGGTFRIEADGEDKTGPLTIPDTGGGQTWTTITATNVPLIAGHRVLRVMMLNEGASGFVGNFNYFSFALAASNSPPSVNLVSPIGGSGFAMPAVIPLSAVAMDADGSVAKVEFFANNALLGAATNPPFSLLWSNPAAGTYALTARAMDNLGFSATSVVSSITVTNLTWSNQDLGTVAATGSFSVNSNSVFNVTGSGADLWNTSDGGHFVYRPISGNAEIVARVVSVPTTHEFSKGGTMFRETLSGSSRNCFMGMTRDYGPAFQYRTNTTGSSYSYRPVVLPSPMWVRLRRLGNIFIGYRSTDGINWTQHHSISNFISTTAYVGLAVSSHTDGVLGTSTFDNVAIYTPPVILTPPVSQSVNSGAAAQFQVVATGAQPLRYQWMHNGTPIAGATNFAHFIPSAQPGQVGNYSVIITNYLGAITTVIVQLSIKQPPIIASPGGYLSNGLFRMTIQGINGDPIRIEVSTNLVDWSSLITNTLSNGVLHYVDPETPAWTHRFYRARYAQ